MQDTFFVDPVERAPGAAHAHAARCRSARCSTRELPVYVARARPGLPHRRARRDAHARSSTRSRASPIDKGLTMAHLRGTLEHFARALFGDEAQDPPAPQLLPVHRAERRDGRLAAERQGRRALDRVGRLRHGQPQRAARGRHRPRGVPGLRVRHGHRAHAAVPQRHERHARHGRGRCPLQQQFGMVV